VPWVEEEEGYNKPEDISREKRDNQCKEELVLE